MKTFVNNDFNGAIYWVQSFSKDCSIKVTSVKMNNFNSFEDYQIAFTIKVNAPKGKVFSDTKRKSKMQTFYTNSTWVEDFDYSNYNELTEELNEYFNSFI